MADQPSYKALIKVFDHNGNKFEIDLRQASLDKLREKINAHLALVDEESFDTPPKTGVR